MKSSFFLALALLAAVCVGCETPAPTPNAAANTTAAARDTIDFQVFRKGDKIKIEFGGTETARIQPIETEIKDDGTVSCELIGPQKAAGRTARELEVVIREAYVPKYFKQLNVVVSSPERVYYVSGQVKTPGVRPYLGRVTVLQAIASAGDFTDFADKKSVTVTRPSGETTKVDCKQALRKPALDIEIFPNDKIHVPQGL